jgi:hypothetical protein
MANINILKYKESVILSYRVDSQRYRTGEVMYESLCQKLERVFGSGVMSPARWSTPLALTQTS